LLWSEADRSLRDDGLWPRLAIDSQGRSVVAFITPVFGTVLWMIAVEREGRWNAVRIHLATGSDVEGRVPRISDQRFARGVVGQTGQSLLAWAPSVSTAPSGRVLCGYGSGFLRLVEIDTPSLSLSQTGVDVDRTLGFFPALAPRANGAAVLTYKDMFGSAELGAASRDELFYFCEENHNEVPSRNSGPLPPTHFIGGLLSLEDFGAHEALNCDRLVSPEEASPDTIVALGVLSALGFTNTFDQFLRSAADRKRPLAMIRSLLRDRQFHVMFNPSGQFRFQFPFQFEWSHPGLSAMIDRLPSWPGVLQYTVDNTAFPDEDIERFDVAIVVNPVATLEARFGDDLDRAAGSRSGSRARMPISEELYRLLTVQHGLTLSNRTALQITRVLAAQEQASTPGRNWIIVDPNPFDDVRLLYPTAVQPEDGSADPTEQALPLTYRLSRREDGGIEVRLDPIVTITDRARFRDRNGHLAPCGVSQHWWDLFASTGFVAELTGALPDVSQLIQNDEVTIHHVLVRGVHLDRYEWLRPAGGQQGAIGFTYAVAQFAAAGVDNAEHAHFHSWTTEPSTIDVVAAPFINAHERVEWHVRDLGFRQGHVEVDVQDWGDFQWVRDLLPFVPVVGSAFVAIAGRIIGWLAEYEANQRTQRFGGLGGELRSRLQQFTDEAFGDQHTEAVFLDRWWLWRWGRLPLPPAPQTRLTTVPAELHFGGTTLGAPPAIRPFLLSNDGMLPVMIDELRITQGDDAFRVDLAPPWPVVLARGASQTVVLAFAPQGSVGIRTGEITVRFNGTESLTLPLDGRAEPAPVPRLRTVPPDRVHFGSVVVGQIAQASVEMRNEGQGALEVRAAVIDADPGAQGAFTATAQTPLVVESSAATQIAVVFAPRATTPGAARARLQIESNDPDRPIVWIELFGAAAASQILVTPHRITFNPSPLVSELPPGMGSTRTIYVYNTGTASLTVQGSSFRAVDPAGSVSPHFQVLDLQGGPVPEATLVMQGGQSLGFSVMFRPTAVGPHEARIHIASSDATRPLIVIPVLGEGIA
jgi:hypothetical protein